MGVAQSVFHTNFIEFVLALTRSVHFGACEEQLPLAAERAAGMTGVVVGRSVSSTLPPPNTAMWHAGPTFGARSGYRYVAKFGNQWSRIRLVRLLS